MSIDAPGEAVSALAQRLELGRFERRVLRRPGVPGLVFCCVLLIVTANFLANGPYNALTVTGMTLALFSVTAWVYVWFRRTRGGLYVFTGGFVDAAGRRLVGARWADVVSISAEETSYAVNSLPAGTTLHYTLKLRRPSRPETVDWTLTTTYADVAHLAGMISRRAGVPIKTVSPPGH